MLGQKRAINNFSLGSHSACSYSISGDVLRTVHHSPKDHRLRYQKLYADNILGNLKNTYHGLKILHIHDPNVMLLTCLELYCYILMSQTRYEDRFSYCQWHIAAKHSVWLLCFPQPQSDCFKNGLCHYHNIFIL